jgi:hypothetical protein
MSTGDRAINPPMPRLAMTVGVVGHRPDRLPDDRVKMALVENAVATVLDRISWALRVAHDKYGRRSDRPGVYTADQPLISLVSALAEGADRIAAHAAVARPDYVLDAPLPFLKEVYEKDFGPQKERRGRPVDEAQERERSAKSIAEFRQLTESSRSVLELPGTRGDVNDPSDPEAAKAYEVVGLTILGQADLLLAIWDGGISRGRGGTPDMLNAAARLGVPILHVDAKGEKPTRVCWSGLSKYPHQVNMVEDLPSVVLDDDVLRALIDDLVKPPQDAGERKSLSRYLSEPSRSFNGWFAFPALMWVFRARSMRRTDWRPARFDTLAAHYEALANAETVGPVTARPAQLALAFGWADAIATRYGQVFRSAFVLNFLLAALAVGTVAVSLVAHDIGDPEVLKDLAHHKVGFVALEVLFIIAVLLITIFGRRKRWHHRWLEAREVAERLRVALPLWILGARPGVFFGPEPAWTGWYVRAMQRQQGLRACRFDPQILRNARETLLSVLTEQRDYHKITAHRMRALAHHIERFGEVLFGLTLLAAILFLWILVLTHVSITPRQAFLLTALAAGLPALATASYGIRVIGDFEGVAHRSHRTRDALDRLIAAIEDDWPEGAAQPPSFALLRARAHATRDAMLGDVENWRLAAESRDLAIPG